MGVVNILSGKFSGTSYYVCNMNFNEVHLPVVLFGE